MLQISVAVLEALPVNSTSTINEKKIFQKEFHSVVYFFVARFPRNVFETKKIVQTPYNLHAAPFGNLKIIKIDRCPK